MTMKKKYGMLLCIAFLATACSSDQLAPSVEEQQIPTTNVYETITQSYQNKDQKGPSTPTTFGFWGWFQKVATADAKAAAAYAVKHGMKSDWKEALLIGAAASVGAALTGNSSKTTTSTTHSSANQVSILSDVMQIKSAANTSNFMDDIGYTHYVLVNEVLKDPTISQLAAKEDQGNFHDQLYDKVYSQAQKLGIQAIYDKPEAVMLLDKIKNTAGYDSDTYYQQLFSFKNPKDQADFKAIDKLYTRTFNTFKSPAILTAYSKEIETAVLQDETLSQTVKEILLLEMATYRFGFTYYTSGL